MEAAAVLLQAEWTESHDVTTISSWALQCCSAFGASGEETGDEVMGERPGGKGGSHTREGLIP